MVHTTQVLTPGATGVILANHVGRWRTAVSPGAALEYSVDGGAVWFSLPNLALNWESEARQPTDILVRNPSGVSTFTLYVLAWS